ncbi:MAG: cobyrinate a,c-diamide synthase, partial [Caldimicrobium sp.]
MVKGILVSAPRSGEGKTLLTLGLLHLFKRKGFVVQPFKLGPDFIDPKWHFEACGVPSYNLDLFSMGKERLKALFYTKAKESQIIVVEGVMGLFDGAFSTFKIAKLLRLPILLVINAFGVGESLKYLLKGFSEAIKRAGLPFFIFLNKVSSEGHLLRLEKTLKPYKIFGYLLRNKEFELPSRHLGLYLPEDLKIAQQIIEKLSFELEKNVDFSLLKELEIEENSSPFMPTFLPSIPYKAIALAYDSAFNFYYPHLLEELSKKTKIYYFSPLKDEVIPDAAEAVYIGGGYPELFAEKLSQNKRTIKAIKKWVKEGRPLYAECGGLVFLSRALTWENITYKLTNIFPFEMEKKGLS